jgi:hypothetical protein
VQRPLPLGPQTLTGLGSARGVHEERPNDPLVLGGDPFPCDARGRVAMLNERCEQHAVTFALEQHLSWQTNPRTRTEEHEFRFAADKPPSRARRAATTASRVLGPTRPTP